MLKEILQHDCANIMLLTYHIKYPSAVGLTFAFVTDIMAHRGGHFNKSNAKSSHGRRRSDVINQVPRVPSKRTMITLNGGWFTATTIHMLIYIFKNMFNGSWATWNEVNMSTRDELWTLFKEDSMRKLYLGLMSNARDESIKMARLNKVEFDGSDFSVLKPYNP
ncbi:hypothetical protein Tco_1064517 [Tanacetum coccineum]